MTQMVVSARNGATQLCAFEQWCEPGHGAPTHLHTVKKIYACSKARSASGAAKPTSPSPPGQFVVVPGWPQARLRQQRRHDLAHPVHPRRARLRSRLRRQARNAAALAAGVGRSLDLSQQKPGAKLTTEGPPMYSHQPEPLTQPSAKSIAREWINNRIGETAK
jgi:hypothetical protein